MDAVVWLEEVGTNDLSVVGGKGASLGEMIDLGVPVPGGFAVKAQAFWDFIYRAGIAKKLFEALNVDVNQESELHHADEMAKKLIRSIIRRFTFGIFKICEWTNDVQDIHKKMAQMDAPQLPLMHLTRQTPGRMK